MKVFLFITITYLAGGVQTNVVPIDTMELCQQAAAQVIRTNTIPNTMVTATCLVQGH